MENIVVYEQTIQFFEPPNKIIILTHYKQENNNMFKEFFTKNKDLKLIYFGNDELTYNIMKSQIIYQDSNKQIDLYKAKSMLLKVFTSKKEKQIAIINDDPKCCDSICFLLSFIKIYCDKCFELTYIEIEKKSQNSDQPKLCFNKIKQLSEEEAYLSGQLSSYLYCNVCRDIENSQISSTSQTLLKNGLQLSQYIQQQQSNIKQQISHEFVITTKNLGKNKYQEILSDQPQQNLFQQEQNIPSDIPNNKDNQQKSSLIVNKSNFNGFRSEDFQIEQDGCPKQILTFQAKKQNRNEVIIQ